jgi:hypothetical protein
MVATLILPTAQLPLRIRTHTNNNITILNNIQLLNLASGSWLQSRSQTYAYAYAKLRHYGVVYGTYGSRWPGDLRPLTTLVMMCYALSVCNIALPLLRTLCVSINVGRATSTTSVLLHIHASMLTAYSQLQTVNLHSARQPQLAVMKNCLKGCQGQ